jgi:hypothetical protein
VGARCLSVKSFWTVQAYGRERRAVITNKTNTSCVNWNNWQCNVHVFYLQSWGLVSDILLCCFKTRKTLFCQWRWSWQAILLLQSTRSRWQHAHRPPDTSLSSSQQKLSHTCWLLVSYFHKCTLKGYTEWNQVRTQGLHSVIPRFKKVENITQHMFCDVRFS